LIDKLFFSWPILYLHVDTFASIKVKYAKAHLDQHKVSLTPRKISKINAKAINPILAVYW